MFLGNAHASRVRRPPGRSSGLTVAPETPQATPLRGFLFHTQVMRALLWVAYHSWELALAWMVVLALAYTALMLG